MQRRGDDEPVRAASLAPALRLVHERASHAAPAHLGGNDERGELHDWPSGVQHGARVHGGETDRRAIDFGDEGVVARRSQTPEPLRQLGRISRIAEMREKRRQRRSIGVRRATDLDRGGLRPLARHLDAPRDIVTARTARPACARSRTRGRHVQAVADEERGLRTSVRAEHRLEDVDVREQRCPSPRRCARGGSPHAAGRRASSATGWA